MAHVGVLVPWHPADAHRTAAWEWVRSRYAEHHPDWEVVTGSCPDGPWVKAVAVADALTRCSAEILLIADADVWCDGLTRALDALDELPWAIPHHTVYRLTQEATASVLAGGPLGGSTTERPYKGWAGGGLMALHRSVYQSVPLDPRFRGWGGEYAAWHLALTKITGRGFRGRADLWHLWHPPQPRVNRTFGSEESAELLNRYQRARTPEAMSELLAEVTDGKRTHRPEPQGCS